MLTTHLNLFDAGIIGVMLLSCLFAFFRGFVREILSLGAWVGAGIVTLYYFKPMAEAIKPHVKNEMVAGAFGTLGIYILALIGFSIINMFILKFVKSGSDVGMLDNMMGLIFGAFRGALIVSLGFFLLTIAMPEKEYPDWLKQSVTRPYVEKGAVMLARIAPDYLRDVSSLENKALAQAKGGNESSNEEDKDTQSEKTAEAKPDNHGYSSQTTRQLDRLLGGTAGSQ